MPEPTDKDKPAKDEERPEPKDQLSITQHVFTNSDATLKAAGSPGLPLSDSQKAYFQARVDAVGKDFQSAVQNARGPLPDSAKTGAVFFAAEAKKMGLIDRVGGESFALGVLKKEMRARG